MCFLHDEVPVGQLPIPYFFIEVLFVFSSKSFCFHKLLPQFDVSSTNSSSDHSRSVTFAAMAGVTRKAGRAINHVTLPAKPVWQYDTGMTTNLSPYREATKSHRRLSRSSDSRHAGGHRQHAALLRT
jgi:hypothetical protein